MGAFSVFNDKRSQKNSLPTVKEHYEKLARRTALIRYICLIAVAVYAVYSFSFHGSELTVENFRYMLKFVNLDSEEEVTPVGTTINFDGNEGNRGLLYKGDLAVINEGGLTVTGWDGNITLKASFAYDHPKMVENGSYLFCYDIGGKDIKVFNSYSQVWSPEQSFDYPIYWLAASKNGEFAVVSSAKGYRSAVYVYDGEFRQIYSRFFGDKYIDYTDIAPDGRSFIVAGHYSENGNLVTLVSRFACDKEEPIYSKTFIGEIPLGIYYTDNGYALMTSDALHIFGSEDGKVLGSEPTEKELCSVSFSGKNLISGRIYGDKALLSYRLDGLAGGTQVVVYGLDGAEILTREFSTSLTDAAICENTLYTLSPGKLSQCALSGSENKVYEVPTSYSSLIPDGSRVIIFSDNEADYFNEEDYERTAY